MHKRLFCRTRGNTASVSAPLERKRSMKSLTQTVESVWLKLKRIAAALAKGEDSADFYITGPDALPPPLSPEAEGEAISAIETDPSARKLPIEHNLRLVVYIARKFENSGTNIDRKRLEPPYLTELRQRKE